MPTIAERVAAGAAFLDFNEPGWEDFIDPDGLCMGNPCECVLGQLFDEYEDCRPGFAIGRERLGLSSAQCVELGFDAESRTTSGQRIEFPALRREWLSIIAERRSACPT